MIKTENLTFQYQKENKLFSFPDINLKAQENLLILGKSGIGKTTFLHLLAGLLQPIQGNVTIAESNINKLSNNKLDQFRGKNIGLVFQKKHAITSLSVLKNIKARLFFSKSKVKDSDIDTILNQLEIGVLKHKKVNELSEGQLQRLSIAMAVIHKPKIILADEPTSSLDDDSCKIVIKLLKEQAKQAQANLIVITHDERIKHHFQNQITLS
ncbi:ABC transporter ATP-binding protein [uncultured Tenacibaculum sp.]|uniref:ABC transporter ATP-binding protein n=1 Tax=uncultured Tenacibaculum sp. TaxID=174713 RepID=UPI00260DB172|nr:ATP-binding cassette domain-containing protein [uncultured Tenacibaculum sp.]